MQFSTFAAVAAALTLAAQPVLAEVKVPEGTEFPMRLEETISSKTATEGERFTITLDDDVPLGDGTVLHAGYRGVGEIINAEKNGMMGKTGKLNITVSYLKIGDQRVRLRAVKAAQGDHRTGAQVATVILFGVFAGLVKGKNIEIKKGTMLTAYADGDVVLTEPVAAPPPEV